MITKEKLDELRHEAFEQIAAQGPPSAETLQAAPAIYANYIIRGIYTQDRNDALRMILEDECNWQITEAARLVLRTKLNL